MLWFMSVILDSNSQLQNVGALKNKTPGREADRGVRILW
ncbi:hypothetical protein [Pseudomonas sp. FEN]|nr:hypothetical protein [Pseudomonas sp. FEN]